MTQKDASMKEIEDWLVDALQEVPEAEDAVVEIIRAHLLALARSGAARPTGALGVALDMFTETGEVSGSGETSSGCMFSLAADDLRKAVAAVVESGKRDGYVLVGMAQGDGEIVTPDGTRGYMTADAMATRVEDDAGQMVPLSDKGAVCVLLAELLAACNQVSGQLVIHLGSKGMRLFYAGEEIIDIASSLETIAEYKKESAMYGQKQDATISGVVK